jgi:hypothetical protein
MRVLPETLEIANEITEVLAEKGGRAADSGISLPFLMSMAVAAGDGDHVDIGTLYGASAIAVAKIKKEKGLEGEVYCIDPYDAEVRDSEVHGTDQMRGALSASEEELMANADHFDVKLKLIKEYSNPWPEKLKDKTFVSGYIDGDHKGDAPWNDFENLRTRVTGYIGTDNYEEEYPAVVDFVLKAADTPDWFLWYKNLIFVALRRILPHRSDPNSLNIMLAK